MKVIVLDAEYNQPSGKTIEIGAAIFDAKSGQLVDKIEFYVNPKEPINPEITELTGIKDSDVANGLNIAEAYEELRKFHAKYKLFRNPLVWGAGAQNDSQHIWKESGSKEENFMGYRVIDVKSIFQSIQVHHNKQYAGSLESVCKMLKIPFEGKTHRALTDAINTFRVWYHLMKRFNDDKT